MPNACCVSNDGNLILVGMQNGCWKIVDIETMLTIDENHDLNDSISDIQAGPSMMCFFSTQCLLFSHGGLYRWRENSLPFFYTLDK